jgi:hypothetical protein
MYHILDFCTIIFSILLSQKINSNMVKFEMVVLTGRGKADVDGLPPGCCSLLLECWWMREKADVMWTRVRYNPTKTGTRLAVQLILLL